uniref:hypothetical protein n=1 Tax=uncultured Paracoccus sp. TaxID=189685 RepID=UPI0025972776
QLESRSPRPVNPFCQHALAIRKTGPERVLLSTDFGQVNSDPFPEGSVRYAMELGARLDGVVSRTDFPAMFSDNGRRALAGR